MVRKYDLFISHASEDKDTLVRPLAEALRAFGVSVWYDEFTLAIGDSLSRSIDRGLTDSEFGLVVLSPDFLKKGWPEYELRGLIAKEIGGRKVILPMWHNLDRNMVLAYSPPLADKVAIRTSDMSVARLAHAIIGEVRPDLFEKIQRRIAFRKAKCERKTVGIKKVLLPRPRHKSLPPNLVSRVRLVRAALLGVYTLSMQNWIDGFRCDSHPSQEIGVWEHVAACYLEYCAMAKLTLKQHESVYKIILGMSCGQGHDKLAKVSGHLPVNALEQLERIWQHALPVFDVADEPFPADYSISDETQEMLKKMDKESFPFDVPDELIADLVQTEEGDENDPE